MYIYKSLSFSFGWHNFERSNPFTVDSTTTLYVRITDHKSSPTKVNHLDSIRIEKHVE